MKDFFAKKISLKEKPHLAIAHVYWKNFLKPGHAVIDATCGNGQDSLILAQNIFSEGTKGKLFLFDIQKIALDHTQMVLRQKFSQEMFSHIHFFQQSHEEISSWIETMPIHLIVYNLGYLPGGDKTIVTRTNSTLASIEQGLKLVETTKGALSITCYSGHEEGEKEERAVLEKVKTLSSKDWLVCHHQWLNRKKAPSLLWIQRIS